ncbi:RNA-binding protein 5/10 [Pelomyxa schiedti]|nr:RNA-binding protein 5/10 [Pelomyxa schiedti]
MLRATGGVLLVDGQHIHLEYSRHKTPVPKDKGDWKCVHCRAINFARREVCFVCHEPRPPPDRGGNVIFVRGLGAFTTKDAVVAYFGAVAPIKDVQFIKDASSGSYEGSCTVEFTTPEGAVAALGIPDAVIGGKPVTISLMNQFDTTINSAIDTNSYNDMYQYGAQYDAAWAAYYAQYDTAAPEYAQAAQYPQPYDPNVQSSLPTPSPTGTTAPTVTAVAVPTVTPQVDTPAKEKVSLDDHLAKFYDEVAPVTADTAMADATTSSTTQQPQQTAQPTTISAQHDSGQGSSTDQQAAPQQQQAAPPGDGNSAKKKSDKSEKKALSKTQKQTELLISQWSQRQKEMHDSTGEQPQQPRTKRDRQSKAQQQQQPAPHPAVVSTVPALIVDQTAAFMNHQASRPVCLLCKRIFRTDAALEKHVAASTLHKYCLELYNKLQG